MLSGLPLAEKGRAFLEAESAAQDLGQIEQRVVTELVALVAKLINFREALQWSLKARRSREVVSTGAL